MKKFILTITLLSTLLLSGCFNDDKKAASKSVEASSESYESSEVKQSSSSEPESKPSSVQINIPSYF